MFRPAVLMTSLVLANIALAHHGISNFDLNKDLTLTGVVNRVELVNPHSWLHVDVQDKSGKSVAWRCEMRAATVLRRSGWSAQMFKTGERVTVTGSPDRTKPNVCYLGSVVFADGHSMDRYGQLQKAAPAAPATRPARLANGNPNIAGDWAAEQRVMTDPRGISGAFLPLSQAENSSPVKFPRANRHSPERAAHHNR